MNRRFVLVDDTETTNYMSLYGIGLGNEIYTVQSVEEMNEQDMHNFLTIGEGDAVMLVGSSPFKFLQRFYHFGIRNENYADCAMLERLSIEGGAFVKCVTKFPTKEDIFKFMSPDFTRKVEFTGFKQSLIQTYEEAIKFIDYMDSLSLDTNYGFDYETSGLAMDKVFYVSGASLVTLQIGAFLSFTDIRHEVGENSEAYNNFLKRLGEFLKKRMDHVWVYNMQFEFQVSHRILGVDLYNLCDASVVNIMDGCHLKKYSLKWTAQRILGVNVWDTEFDRISDTIDKMMFVEVGKLKRDKHKSLIVTPDNFEQTPEWKYLEQRYPDDIGEMKSLMLEYWGMSFMVPSSRLLGYYCCLDSFHTLMLYEVKKDQYSKDCWQVNLDNTRLGCRLMTNGLYIDEPFRARYENYCKEQMAWSITYCAMARCWVKMDKHKKLANNIKRYKPEALKILKMGMFHGGDALGITKDLLMNNLDTMDAYDSGLNEGKLLMTFGDKFAGKFIDIVNESRAEVKMKDKIDSSIQRKRKILGIIAEKIKPLLGLDKLNLGNKHIELEKYIYYETAYNELQKIINNQLVDINRIPSTIYAFGEKRELLEYSDYVGDNYFKCKSPIENDEIALEFTKMYKAQTAYLTAMFESTQQLPETTKFYESRGITDISVGFSEFMTEWEAYYKTGQASQLYPEKAFQLALRYFQHPEDDKVKETWTNINGFVSQTQLFPEFTKQYNFYEQQFDPNDFSDDFMFMRKFVLNYLVYKKYAKLNSTYVGSDGMFKKNNKYVIEDEYHIPIRDAEPEEPGAVEKCFVHYEVNTKSSKRWSSGFHTIIAHGDCKDVLCPPPSWDNNGNIIYGGSDQLLTYFDISSAEVKAAGFASKDPDLIAKFNAGEDIYIYSAKLYLGESGWNALNKKQKKMWRKRFKTVFLGVLYGLGKKSLAERLDSSLEEADHIIQSLYTSFPQLRVYVDKQGQYPLDHDGYVNTMLGDKLRVREADLIKEAKTDYERQNLLARMKRLGVNLPIQGGTSSIMACGFFNNIRVSEEQGWKMPLQPIIVVHDSNTNYVPVEKIFDMREYYNKNYTAFCAGINPPGIFLLFDLLAGYSYELAAPLKQIDPDTIEFSGSATSIIKIYDKIMGSPNIKTECDTERDQIISQINLVDDPYYRFILEGGCNMTKDLSSVTVRFHRTKNDEK
jgi:hypothetical protein